MENDEMLIRVIGPTFVCGLVAIKNKIIKSAPYLKWCIGKDVYWLEDYCEERGWEFEILQGRTI
jgi:hypothetical protein